MVDQFIPVQQFLSDGLQASNGKFQCTEPHLGFVGEQRVGGASTQHIGRQLSQDEYTAFQDAVLFLGRNASDHQLIELAHRNYRAYADAMRTIEDQYKANYSLDWNRINEMVIEVNRHILNFLTSMKTFLDHTETRLNRTYGEASERFKSYKSAEHSAFDNNFSYRFVSKLRNYAQHCGMPLGWINAHSDLDDLSKGTVTHSIDFFFNRDNLLKNFKEWSKHVGPELQKMPENFSITPHLQKTAECLVAINTAVLAEDVGLTRQHMKVIERLLADVGPQNGMPCIVESCSAELIATDGKVKANIGVQRFQMQHIEATRKMLADFDNRK